MQRAAGSHETLQPTAETETSKVDFRKFRSAPFGLKKGCDHGCCF